MQANYLRIENPPFMRLVIEVVGTLFPNGTCEVSVAHYGEQNGDAMRDPEVTFLVIPSEDGEWQWKPLSFLNDYVGIYQVAAEYDNFGRLRVRDAKLMRDIRRPVTSFPLRPCCPQIAERSASTPNQT